MASTGWTRVNFDDLPDSSPEDVRMEWRFARPALGSPELGISRFAYAPGARMPFAHRHREQEELYVVTEGSGRARLDDATIELGPGDALRVAPAVVRTFEAGADGLVLLCVGGRRPEGRGDGERLPDPGPLGEG